MKWNVISAIMIPLLGLSLIGSAYGATYPVSLEYSRITKFPNLQKKIGSTLGIAPFRDQRTDKVYIGRYVLPRNLSSYFKSEPVSLVGTIQESVRKAVSGSGVATIALPGWDGNPDSMRNMRADSVLTVVVKRFWVEGNVIARRTTMNASMHFIFYLGVKKLGKVFTQNVFVEQKRKFDMRTPQDVVQWVNRTFADALDSFLRNPY